MAKSDTTLTVPEDIPSRSTLTQYPGTLGFQFLSLGVHFTQISIFNSLTFELNTYPKNIRKGMDCEVNDIDPDKHMRNNVSQALSVRHKDTDVLQ